MNRVLVVDDEPGLVRAIGINLRAHGWDVVTATSGTEALDVAATEHPDVILLDLGLPGLDGIEVCRQVRTFSDCYILMLTARDDETDRIIGLGVGADDYIGKPIALAELWARVQVHIRALDQMEGALEVQRRSSERASERTSLFSALRSQLKKLGDTPSELPGHAERLSGIVSTLDRLDGADPASCARSGTIARHAGLQKALAKSSLSSGRHERGMP